MRDFVPCLIICSAPICILVAGIYLSVRGLRGVARALSSDDLPRTGIALLQLMLGVGILASPVAWLIVESTRDYPAAKVHLRDRIIVGMERESVREILGAPGQRPPNGNEWYWLYNCDWAGGSYFQVEFNDAGKVTRTNYWIQ